MIVTKCCGKTTALKKALLDDGQEVRWRRCAACGALYCARGDRMALGEVRWGAYREVLSSHRVVYLMRSGAFDRMLASGKLVVDYDVDEDGWPTSKPTVFRVGSAPLCRESDACVVADDERRARL